MSVRTRRATSDQEQPLYDDAESGLELESLTDDELETFLFDEPEEKPKGLLNLPTIAGLSLIFVGIMYMFQELGIWGGFDLSNLVSMLPWLAGILIILMGFGVLSWRPSKKKKKVTVRKTAEMSTGKQKIVFDTKTAHRDKKRLIKSRDKKIAGVCGGIAEYFNIDPTLVRIAFVVGTIATQGSFFLAYLVLSVVMPKPESSSTEERITIIRDI